MKGSIASAANIVKSVIFEMSEVLYDIRSIDDHFEVYVDGKFKCSTDTMTEAVAELEKIMFGERA